MRNLYPNTHRWYLNRHKLGQDYRPIVQPDDIPTDLQAFYADFGLLRHPETAQPVSDLTAYQVDVWRAGLAHRYRLAVKSQKIGLSTSVLLEDFHHAITDCKGFELLVIAQSIPHAREHLYTLRRWILESAKYSGYLMTKRTELVMPDEITKVTVLYIKNPDNPRKPTRIVGLGASEASIWSWKEVKFVHISDIAVVNQKDYSGVISAATSRLANTRGKIIIETPPRGASGRIYEIYKQSQTAGANDKTPETQSWWTTKIPAREAVQAGVISQEFLDEQRVQLGHLYPMYYEAEFLAGLGNLFIAETIDQVESLGGSVGCPVGIVDVNPYTPKALGIDYGMGSSNTAFVLVEFVDGIIRILDATQFERPNFNDMVTKAFEYISHYNLRRVGKTYVDSQAPEFIRELKLVIGENALYEPLVLRARQERRDVKNYMHVCPVPFSIENDAMTQKVKSLVDSGLVAIHPEKFPELLLDLRNAEVDDKGKLIKDQYNKMDLFDALRMATKFFSFNANKLRQEQQQQDNEQQV